MAKEFFDFDLEADLGIEEIDREHMKMRNLLLHVQTLLGEGKKDEVRAYFAETLTAYINEHFANEEKFMAKIGYPGLEEHREIHNKFRKTVEQLALDVNSFDEAAFYKALSETYTWLVSHIGTMDKRYAAFYMSKR